MDYTARRRSAAPNTLTASRHEGTLSAAFPVQLSGQLNAPAIDAEARTLSGLLVPYNVTGQTSIGPIAVKAGALTWPEDLSRVKLFSDHDRTSPVGYLVEISDDPDGIRGTFYVAKTPAGDAALLDASEKIRDAFSVELDTLTLSDDETEVESGYLRGVALLSVPAFDDARLGASRSTQQKGSPMLCTTCGREHDAAVSCAQHTANLAAASASTVTVTTPSTAPVQAGDAQSLGALLERYSGDPNKIAAALMAGLQAVPVGAPAGGAPVNAQRTGIESLDQFYAAMVAKHSLNGQTLSREIEAALDDITYANNSGAMPPQWVGQLWQGVKYQRKVVPLLGTPKALTGRVVNGWKWAVKPEVDTYSGDKTEVPSNAADTIAVTTNAALLAGAHDIDRSFRDFGVTEFFQAYYEAMAESYAKKSDTVLADWLETNATDEATPAYLYLLGAIAAGVEMIGDATNSGATFVLLNNADLIPWVLATTNDDMPARLDLLGVDLDRIVAHSAITAGHAIVGTESAASFYELPGSPIRVEAIDLANAGVDAGVFGYHAEVLHDAGGLVDVTIDNTP